MVLHLKGAVYDSHKNPKHKLMYLNFYKMFDPTKIQNINSNNFIDLHKINISKNSINEYKIINMIGQYEDVSNIIKNKNNYEGIYNILINLLPHMNLNGRNINIEECLVLDLLKSNVQSFPYIHTDVEWKVFYDSDAFQVWYLYENEEDVGNMFLFDTKIVKPSRYLEYYDNFNLSVRDHNTCEIIEKVKIDDMDLNMKKGECLIFGKNLYHMSDFRKSKYRYAINFRVLIKDPDGGIPIDISSNSQYTNLFKFRLSKNNIKIINNKIYPKMFTLLNLI